MVNARNAALAVTGIDLFDTDNEYKSQLASILRDLDPTFDVNFARNGADAYVGDSCVEMKATKVSEITKKTKKPTKTAGQSATWQFHAMGGPDSFSHGVRGSRSGFP